MNEELKKDLDEYFMRTYCDYTAISAISGYDMPDRAGTSTEYSLQGEKYKLINQPRREELLAKLKEKYVDRNFSFSFETVKIAERLKDVRRKYTFKKILPKIFTKYSLDIKSFYERIEISPYIWKKLTNGSFYPEKNTVFAIAIAGGISHKDAQDLLAVCGYEFDYTSIRDVVVSYILSYKIFSGDIVKDILAEYKITCLPLK